VQDGSQQGQEQPGGGDRDQRIGPDQQDQPDDGHSGHAHARAGADHARRTPPRAGLPGRDQQRVAAEGGHSDGHRQPGEGLEQRQVQAQAGHGRQRQPDDGGPAHPPDRGEDT
jgi:hypothetical protein